MSNTLSKREKKSTGIEKFSRAAFEMGDLNRGPGLSGQCCDILPCTVLKFTYISMHY